MFAKPPSAELRPGAQEQEDEKDLMPYAVLDAYLEWFLVERISPAEMLVRARQQLAAYYADGDDAIRRDIRRFVSRVAMSQWKRVREANSLRVMPYDIDPDSGLRWPCLMDGFTQALQDM